MAPLHRNFTTNTAIRKADFPTNQPELLQPTNQNCNQSTGIEVLDLRLCAPGRSRLRAVATVRIGDLTIHDVRVVANGRRHLVELPDRWDGASWRPIVTAEPGLLVALNDAVIEAWKGATYGWR